jgi:hypothetical protein
MLNFTGVMKKTRRAKLKEQIFREEIAVQNFTIES